jgi:hypothetical protein
VSQLGIATIALELCGDAVLEDNGRVSPWFSEKIRNWISRYRKTRSEGIDRECKKITTLYEKIQNHWLCKVYIAIWKTA